MKIARTFASLGSVAAIAAATLLAAGPAQAAEAPAPEVSSTVPTDSSGVPISSGLSGSELIAIRDSLQENNEVLSVEEEGSTRTTTYDVEGFAVSIEETRVESPSPTARWDINTQYLPRYIFVYLYKADQQALASGGLNALNIALCAIPGVGWASCAALSAGIQGGGEYLKSKGLCKGTFAITFDFNSNPKPWIRYACQ